VTSYDLPAPEVFTTGTVGTPGQRAFYFQARDGGIIVTLHCEKQQVAALAEYFDGLLDDLEPTPYGIAVGDLELSEPFEEGWTVGSIGVAYDEPGDRIVVVLEELVEEDDEGASLRVRLTRAQVSAFVNHARTIVAAGRPPCRLCGLPLDPEGHACPRLN